MFRPIAPIAALLLTACGAATGTGGVTSSPLDPDALSGNQLIGPGSFVTTSDVAFSGALGVDLAFDASGVLIATFPDSGAQYVMTYDDKQKAYVTADGFFKITASSQPSTPDVYVFKMIYAGNPQSGDETLYFTSGFLTDGASLPQSGSASYQGEMEFTDQLAQTASGQITLNVEFFSGFVSGDFSVQEGTVMGAASFAFDGESIVKGDGYSYFNAHANSTDSSGYSGDFTGDFMGSTGQEIGGTVALSDAENALAGVFTASR